MIVPHIWNEQGTSKRSTHQNVLSIMLSGASQLNWERHRAKEKLWWLSESKRKTLTMSNLTRLICPNGYLVQTQDPSRSVEDYDLRREKRERNSVRRQRNIRIRIRQWHFLPRGYRQNRHADVA